VEIPIVISAELDPGVTEAEDKLQEVVAGAPEQLSDTTLEKLPDVGEICSVYVAVSPGLIVLLALPLEIVKSAPTPFKVETWGLPGALSLTVTDPVCAPELVGVNVTLIEQLPDGGRFARQLFVCEKSPETCIPVIERVAFPTFVKLNTCA
jgi:hypothetical protein